MRKRSIMSNFVSPTRAVFSNKPYLLLAIVIASAVWIVLNVFDQVLFFSPVLAFYIPDYAVAGFAISNIATALMGIVVSMIVYAVRNTKSRMGASFYPGPTLGIFSSACASCTSIGLFLVSTFGAAGVATSAFITNYQIPIRLISIGLLIWAYYSVCRKLTTSCSTDIPKKD